MRLSRACVAGEVKSDSPYSADTSMQNWRYPSIHSIRLRPGYQELAKISNGFSLAAIDKDTHSMIEGDDLGVFFSTVCA